MAKLVVFDAMKGLLITVTMQLHDGIYDHVV